MKTAKEIKYRPAPYPITFVIPKGLRVIRATNQPDESYWLDELPKNASEEMIAWHESYGFRLLPDEVK